MEELFKVTSKQVESQISNPTLAVEITRDLLWVEAYRQGIDPTSIHFTQNVFEPDGGVDGTSAVQKPLLGGLIEKGLNCYQVKWGKSFKPLLRDHLEKELIGKKGLKPAVEKLLSKVEEATYTLIWLGGELKSDQVDTVETNIKEILVAQGYENVRVKVMDRTQMASHCSQHLYIISRYFNPLIDYVGTIEDWKTRFEPDDEDVQLNVDVARLLGGVPHEDEIQSIRNAVNGVPSSPVQIFCTDSKDDASGAIHHDDARRIVHDSLNEDGYRQNTIFINADDLKAPISVFLERTLGSMIVVIDNAKKSNVPQILSTLGQRHKRLKFIVITVDDAPIDDPRFSYLGRRGLAGSQLITQLVNHKPTAAITSPTSADLIPEQRQATLPVSSANALKEISKEYGFDFSNAARRVLRYLALFSKVGSETNVTRELRFVARKLGYVEESEWIQFLEILYALRAKGLIDGKYYLKLADKETQYALIREWWEIYGLAVDFEGYLKEIYIYSEDLAQRLLDSVPFITATEGGKRVAQSMLGEGGIYHDGRLLNDRFGAQLFYKLVEADPAAALSCLKRTVGQWSDEHLLSFKTGRREVVSSLEKIAIWQPLFVGASKVLMRLAETENENWANNATGVFSALFSLGYGEVATTQALPKERFPILEEMLDSSLEKRVDLGLKACDVALENVHITRIAGSETQGLRDKAVRWTPKTYGELFDAYKAVWELIEARLDKLSPTQRQRAVEILLQHSRGLIAINALADMVLKTLEALAKRSDVDSKIVLAEVIEILHYDSKKGMPDTTKASLQKLNDELTGNDYHALLERYVGMDLLEDNFDEEGNQTQPYLQKIRALAQESIDNPAAFRKELSWLSGENAKRGYELGKEIASLDTDNILLSDILKALKANKVTNNAYLAGGYLNVLRERAEEEREKVLDELSEDKTLVGLVPELTWRSGLTDRSAKRLLDLVKANEVEITHFHMFGFGGVLADISDEMLQEWVTYLLDSDYERAASIALDFCQFYYVMKKNSPMPERLIGRVLLDDRIYKPIERHRNDMDDYHWTELAKEYVKASPQETLTLGKAIVEHFGEEGTIFGSFHSDTTQVLDTICQQHPKEMWAEITKYLGPPITARAMDLSHWLKGKFMGDIQEKGAMYHFPQNLLWEWVEGDIETRAWYLATFVPPELKVNEGEVSYARELLVRYGEREDVRRNLDANFWSEGWWGEASAHYTQKKQLLLDYAKNENDPKVLQWVEEFARRLDVDIERSVVDEERSAE